MLARERIGTRGPPRHRSNQKRCERLKPNTMRLAAPLCCLATTSRALIAPTRRLTPRRMTEAQIRRTLPSRALMAPALRQRTRLHSETQIDNLERSWNISRDPERSELYQDVLATAATALARRLPLATPSRSHNWQHPRPRVCAFDGRAFNSLEFTTRPVRASVSSVPSWKTIAHLVIHFNNPNTPAPRPPIKNRS